MISIKQLRYALAVWQERSFIRASEKVHISQPAISGQIQQLEKQIGFELFRRTSQGVETTELGRTFLMRAEEVYASMLRLLDTANQLAGGAANSLSVGISSGIAQNIVPVIVNVIEHQKTPPRLHVTTTTTQRINRLLSEDNLDVGIAVDVNPRALPAGLVKVPVAYDEMVVIVPPGHPLRRLPRPVKMDDLVDEPLIMNELAVGYGEFVLSMFADEKLRPQIAAISDNVETSEAMVRCGGGLAIVPRHSIGLDKENLFGHGLSFEPKRNIQIVVVYREVASSSKVSQLIDEISQSLQDSAFKT